MALAAPIDFAFTVPAGDASIGAHSSISRTDVGSGLTVDVTGFQRVTLLATDADVYQGENGLGVAGALGNDERVNGGNLLGLYGEGLVFNFHPGQVSLETLTFNFSNASDDVYIAVDTPFGALGIFQLQTTAGPLRTFTLDLPANIGSTFILSTVNTNDNFTLAGLNVSYSPAAPAVVPLPAAATSGLTLLAATALRRRRGT